MHLNKLWQKLELTIITRNSLNIMLLTLMIFKTLHCFKTYSALVNLAYKLRVMLIVTTFITNSYLFVNIILIIIIIFWRDNMLYYLI